MVAGGLGALGLTRLLGSQLFGVAATDPLALGAAAVVLIVLATIATWLLARRAMGLDPGEVLRH